MLSTFFHHCPPYFFETVLVNLATVTSQCVLSVLQYRLSYLWGSRFIHYVHIQIFHGCLGDWTQLLMFGWQTIYWLSLYFVRFLTSESKRNMAINRDRCNIFSVCFYVHYLILWCYLVSHFAGFGKDRNQIFVNAFFFIASLCNQNIVFF